MPDNYEHIEMTQEQLLRKMQQLEGKMKPSRKQAPAKRAPKGPSAKTELWPGGPGSWGPREDEMRIASRRKGGRNA